MIVILKSDREIPLVINSPIGVIIRCMFNEIYMKLTKEQIEHIALLSRLELSDDELNKYGEQLSAVLGYIDQLQEVHIDGTEPTAQITGLTNVLREDVVEDWDKREMEAALKEAPDLEDGQVKVRRVL